MQQNIVVLSEPPPQMGSLADAANPGERVREFKIEWTHWKRVYKKAAVDVEVQYLIEEEDLQHIQQMALTKFQREDRVTYADQYRARTFEDDESSSESEDEKEPERINLAIDLAMADSEDAAAAAPAPRKAAAALDDARRQQAAARKAASKAKIARREAFEATIFEEANLFSHLCYIYGPKSVSQAYELLKK